MSLLGFQRALAAIVADPGLRRRAMERPAAALPGYDLTPRERRRLADMAGQRGMALNCILHRANRMTPLHRLLPLTCAALGADLARVVDLFWRTHPRTNMQFADEIGRFAGFLKERLAAGEPANPLAEEVLDFECARFHLRFTRPRRGAEGGEAAVGAAGGAPALHPRVRVVAFRHDPERVLAGLAAEGRPPPAAELPEGEHYLVLDGRHEEPRISRIGAPLGRLLKRLEAGGPPGGDAEAAAALARTGLLAPAPSAGTEARR